MAPVRTRSPGADETAEREHGGRAYARRKPDVGGDKPAEHDGENAHDDDHDPMVQDRAGRPLPVAGAVVGTASATFWRRCPLIGGETAINRATPEPMPSLLRST